MDQTTVTKAKVLAIHNAERRMEEIDKLDFVVNAKADYYNGLVQGFIDGAKWALLERLTTQGIFDLLDNEVVVGYIQGILDTHRGVKKAIELQDTWKSVVASEQMNIQEVLKAETRNRVLKRHIEWMQESFDKFYIGGIERYFGKKFYGDDDSRAE
jgi:hypothetical protein